MTADEQQERDRLAADCAVKDAALRRAWPYLLTHAAMMPTVSAHDCTMGIAGEIEKALTDHPGDKLLARLAELEGALAGRGGGEA